MRSLALFSLAAVPTALSLSPSRQDHHVETINVPQPGKDVASVITVAEENRTYVVKFECVGCPYVVQKSAHEAEWSHPPPDNSLMMMLDIAESNKALLLNKQRIFPLDPMPLYINAMQVPTDIEQGEVNRQAEMGFEPMPGKMMFPLQYEHTIFRPENGKGLWLQFNVTGLPWAEQAAPFKLGQKVVQVLLHEGYNGQEVENHTGDGYKLSIADVQVVEAKDRAQPPRMKCGRLAMIQTTFDPNEWDDYGKFGTWARTWNLVVGKLGDFWTGHLEDNILLLPLTLLLAVSIVLARRIYQSRQQENAGRDSDAETALLGGDAPPPYTDIPIIKIEDVDVTPLFKLLHLGHFRTAYSRAILNWTSLPHSRTPLSVQKKTNMSVTVEPYNPEWPQQFSKIKSELEVHLQDVSYLSIEHVGSTSVPDLVAKPIIDIDIIVTRDAVQPAIDALITHGKFDYLGELGVIDRHAFKDAHQPIPHNIYICVSGAVQTRNHLSLRETLRSNAELRDEYARVKLDLSASSTNIISYLVGKTAIVQKILRAAGGFSKEDLAAIARANDTGERFTAIRTRRLLLREFVMKDEAGYFALEGNPENAKYQAWPPRTRQQARQLVLENIRNHNDVPRTIYELAVEDAETGGFVGRVGARTSQTNSDKLPGEESIRPVTHAQLWFSFLQDYQGKGLATEAVDAFISAIKERLQQAGKVEMEIECDPRNEKCWRLAERLGFERVSLTKEKEVCKGEWVDSLVLRRVVGDG
ncbi:arabinogalactan endo-1,4-beta-galactosidase [Stemphylium lycopersici]|uniref:Arabinogalactan endo-1,4-beta-galactosidase n=1 Tax=Stemphylium lycopersici TaxID=183478 RepID=A0A364N7V5_STELY|nr:arabinogalactan endo-1,4-beta-galactosidase [Stemphylium lycopersici]